MNYGIQCVIDVTKTSLIPMQGRLAMHSVTVTSITQRIVYIYSHRNLKSSTNVCQREVGFYCTLEPVTIAAYYMTVCFLQQKCSSSISTVAAVND